MKIYSITNQKGGVGKSTTAQALAAGMAKAGKKVLVIDLDAQGNTSYSMAADMTKPNVYDLMKYRHTLQECIQPTAIDNLFIIAGGQDLVSIETELTTTGKEYRLKELIGKAKFDAVVIDTPPAICTLTSNALTACDYVVIPSQANIYTIEGIKNLADNIATIRKYTNPKIKIAGILLTRHNGRSTIVKACLNALQQLAANIGTKVFATAIPEAIAVQEAQTRKTNIFDYAPKNKATIAYKAFMDELLNG